MNEHWNEIHGIDIIGKVWNGAKDRDDPIDAYKRVTNINQEQFNEQMFRVAQRNILFDYKHLRNILKPFRNRYVIKLQNNSDGTYQISPEQCTQSYGYAPVQLEIPQGGKITVKFTGITGDRKYHTANDKVAGWRFGFVAVKSDGETAEYSKAAVGTTKTTTVNYTIPNGTKNLWFIVMGAPTEHVRHHWKEGDNSGDEHFPWKVALSTCLKGQQCRPISVDNNATNIDGNGNSSSTTPSNGASNNSNCFSKSMGYPCCKDISNVVTTDCDGKWGVENGEWCGIGGTPMDLSKCWAKSLGYTC
eukprot:jgi/Orpsp1_1/1175086/evm.model.c7180000052557.1